MEYIIIAIAALIVSCLTLFSGFGLGTLLMPVFAIFFPIEIAIAITAIVHFSNNLFKLAMLGKYVNKEAAIKFGLPAIFTAFLGAWLMLKLTTYESIFEYVLFDKTYQILPVKMVIAFLMLLFASIDLIPKISFDKKYLPIGGALSGFFGGLSGHQGALRSSFLLKAGLTKEVFIATGVVISLVIDASRMTVYGSHFMSRLSDINLLPIAIAVLFAFLGAFIGKKLLNKVTMKMVRIIVALMLFFIAIGLGMGII